jgi:hypothetical protein
LLKQIGGIKSVPLQSSLAQPSKMFAMAIAIIQQVGGTVFVLPILLDVF